MLSQARSSIGVEELLAKRQLNCNKLFLQYLEIFKLRPKDHPKPNAAMAPEVLINGEAGERQDLIMISDADIAEDFDGMDSFDKIKTVTPQSRQWKGPHDLTRYEVEEEGKEDT